MNGAECRMAACKIYAQSGVDTATALYQMISLNV